jgi:Bifunctional DNA primase/polymerase, N-terminal
VVVVVADFVTCPQGHRFWGDAHTPCPWCIGVAEGVVTADEALLLSWPTDYRPEPLVTPEALRLGEFASVAVQMNGLSLLDAACIYAEVGIPVFPLVEGGKVPHPDLPKRPDGTGGLWLAHTDPARIERWWKARPESNIGLRTGVVFSALDVDTKHDAPGWESVRRVKHLLGGAFAQAVTPTSGGHLLFAPDGDGNHAAGKAGHGLDFRGVGGYIVGSPSVTEQGGYRWVQVDVSRYGPALSWEALTGVLVPKVERPPFVPQPGRTPRLDGLVRTVAESVEGGRNAALHWSACRCVEDGLDPWELLPAALSVGLSEFESRRTIESAVRRAS